MIFDAQLPPVDDSFTGDEVVLLAVRNGQVDRSFRRSYAWVKHAADIGRIKKFTVVVEVSSADWVHTLGAVQSALTGGLLHPAGVFDVRVTVRDARVAQAASAVALQVKSWETTAPEPVKVKPPVPVVPAVVKKDDVVKVGDSVENPGA